MKKIIFYSLIVPNYFSLIVSSVMEKNYLCLVILLYLVVIGRIFAHSKSLNTSSNFLLYLNTLVMYPILIGVLGKGIGSSIINSDVLNPSILGSFGFLNGPSSFLVSFSFAILFSIVILFLVESLNLNREILYFLLIVFTLNTSLFELYLHVESNVFVSIVFHCILNVLMVTSPKSFKVLKRNKKKVKKVEDGNH